MSRDSALWSAHLIVVVANADQMVVEDRANLDAV